MCYGVPWAGTRDHTGLISWPQMDRQFHYHLPNIPSGQHMKRYRSALENQKGISGLRFQEISLRFKYISQ